MNLQWHDSISHARHLLIPDNDSFEKKNQNIRGLLRVQLEIKHKDKFLINCFGFLFESFSLHSAVLLQDTKCLSELCFCIYRYSSSAHEVNI